MTLTPKQLAVLDYIHEFRSASGISPTLEEIARNLGVAKMTIHEHVNQLERKGAVKRERRRKRSIEILPGAPVREEVVS